MGRNLTSVLLRELANLDKDADSRKSAMKELKSYVKDLDSKATPLILAQIDNIMSNIIKTLNSSSGSFPLLQVCSKVVPAIAQYGIDPLTPEAKKRKIVHSLCNPLSDSLLGSQEGLASGAALCLKALVDADNWRFASDEIVNDVCLRVAGALEEKATQTISHMGLAMALAKHNSSIIEAYARSLIRSGLQIMNVGVADGNSQKRLSAIQMVNFLMKCVDPRSIYTELGTVIDEMDKCHSDQMAFVRGAAMEALQTARTIVADKGSRDRSPVSASPEPQLPHTIDSFIEYDSLVESPITTGQVSCNMDYGGRRVNRKLWKSDNGGVDVSLKDGLFSEVGMGSNVSNTLLDGFDDGEISNNRDQSEVFSGFLQESPRNGEIRSSTPSLQRQHSKLNIDDIKIFTTPRKLICSLQVLNDVNSDPFEKQTRKFRSPASKQLQWSPTRKVEGNGPSHDLNYDVEGPKNISKIVEQTHVGSESVSSTGDVLNDAELVPDEVSTVDIAGLRSQRKRSFKMFALNLICCLFFIFLAVVISVTFTDSLEKGSNLVPT
ncbi:hypothetical protein NE237_009517 [Protea cynaroides]|uniref:ARM repeat superfamily protein n=1 Tax=Protea cynaroides TaxID=273540 RepID=A0A9Q0KXW9_9MAGN|nr:hypothetical protein NE237_009517 [Protea cynaroides]